MQHHHLATANTITRKKYLSPIQCMFRTVVPKLRLIINNLKCIGFSFKHSLSMTIFLSCLLEFTAGHRGYIWSKKGNHGKKVGNRRSN